MSQNKQNLMDAFRDACKETERAVQSADVRLFNVISGLECGELPIEQAIALLKQARAELTKVYG